MPKAGIHEARSTNWKPSASGLNAYQRASVVPNDASETASAPHRIRPSRDPSLLGTASSASAPASGRKTTRLSMRVALRRGCSPAFGAAARPARRIADERSGGCTRPTLRAAVARQANFSSLHQVIAEHQDDAEDERR